jgi:urease accessory protein
MQLITQALEAIPSGLKTIAVSVDRHQLARRRWRGVAADGTEFGIDVSEALTHGTCIHTTETTAYLIEQTPESCLLVPIQAKVAAAHMGWMIGNLHFKAAFFEAGILVSDDLAVLQMLERENIPFQRVERVFQPARQGGHSHDHDHSH